MMRTLMVSTLLALMVLVPAAGAQPLAVTADEVREACEPDGPLADVPKGMTGADAANGGAIRFEADLEGVAAEFLFCIQDDADSSIVYRETRSVTGVESMDVEVPVAVGNYTVFVSLESASNRVAGTVSFNLAECVDYVVSGWSIIYATPLGAGITLGADDCPYGERDGAAGSGHGGHGGGNGNATAGHGGHGGDGDSTAGPDDGGHDNSTASGGGHGGGFFEGAVAGATDPRTAAAASLAGLAGLIALSLGKWSVARIAVFGAFSRITKPKALDHQTRAAIHNFIRENPGAEVPRIMEAVGTQNGQTDYHLSVLRREGLVSVVRLGRADHHFERGRLSPADMKKIATLRSANVRQVFETVRRMPDASVGVLAATLSLSEPTVSKAVKRLVDAGLVDRQRQGRRVLLTSRAAPALA